jgi:hypothetical protein
MDATEEITPGADGEKTKYMMTHCHQNAGQYHTMKIDNKYSKNVAEFQHLER